MITDNKLDIFEDFRVNRKPKPKKEEDENTRFFIGSAEGTVLTTTAGWGPDTGLSLKVRMPFKQKIKKFMDGFFDPNTYFMTVKKAMQEIETNPVILERIQQLQNEATETRQTALIEQLNRERTRVENEAKLLSIGFDKAINEEDIVLLSQKAPNIHLTWITNFLRPIPEEVKTLYKKADDTEIFDNFVIMHYGDPKGSIGETEAEIEKRKDPILFGVFRESRRLYYIDDWIDALCDLTLSKLLELTDMDEEDVKLTDERVVAEEV